MSVWNPLAISYLGKSSDAGIQLRINTGIEEIEDFFYFLIVVLQHENHRPKRIVI